jgi:hypothetical protein
MSLKMFSAYLAEFLQRLTNINGSTSGEHHVQAKTLAIP